MGTAEQAKEKIKAIVCFVKRCTRTHIYLRRQRGRAQRSARYVGPRAARFYREQCSTRSTRPRRKRALARIRAWTPPVTWEEGEEGKGLIGCFGAALGQPATHTPPGRCPCNEQQCVR